MMSPRRDIASPSYRHDGKKTMISLTHETYEAAVQALLHDVFSTGRSMQSRLAISRLRKRSLAKR
jgi:hypothetical protein